MLDSTLDQPQTMESMIGGFGAELQRRRTVRGEQLEDIAAYLQIKPTYLYGIEQGDLSVIPGKDQAKACMRDYADYLGLKGGDIVDHLAPIIERLDHGNAPPAPEPRTGLDRFSMIVLASSVVLGIVVGWSYIAKINRFDLLAPAVTAEVFNGPEVSDASSATDTASNDGGDGDASAAAPGQNGTASLDQSAIVEDESIVSSEASGAGARSDDQTGQPAITTQSLNAAAENDAGKKVERPANVLAALVAERGDGAQIYEPENTDARVIIRALATTWVQVSSKTRDYIWTRTMQPREMLMVPLRNDLELWTGDAGGIEVLLDGVILAPLGPPGTVIRGLSLGADSLEATTAEALPQGQSKPTF